ncbi:MAG TPA: hypothetical protein PK239_12380 [Chitinophagales bacterium]|nr:hypothetical protein [Chitinophagales bacterium]HRK28069.1 hypothetical protein [Chitinophagales bacterium]
MAKNKLSPSEVQLLLSHYQKKLKKAEKKLQAAENKVSKLRKKVSRVLFLQQAKQEEVATNDLSEIAAALLPDADATLPIQIANTEPDAETLQQSTPALLPPIKSGKSASPKEKQAALPPKPQVEQTEELAASQLIKRPGRKTAADMEAMRQAVLAEGNNRPISPADWANFILQTIADRKRPLLTKEIISAAQTEFKFADEEMVAEERAIAKSLHNLSNKTNELVKYKEGKMRGFYYCLPQWMQAENELKKTYYNRINRSADS